MPAITPKDFLLNEFFLALRILVIDEVLHPKGSARGNLPGLIIVVNHPMDFFFHISLFIIEWNEMHPRLEKLLHCPGRESGSGHQDDRLAEQRPFEPRRYIVSLQNHYPLVFQQFGNGYFLDRQSPIVKCCGHEASQFVKWAFKSLEP